MQHSTTRVRSVGVDTLTCSAPWEGGIFSFIDLAQGLQREEASLGSKVLPFKRGSYRGAQTRHVGIAFKPGRVLAELRGNWAYLYWPHMTERAEKVSRIDVQVSVWQEPYDHDMALRLYLGERKKAEQRGRPSTFRMQGESDGGTTLYIGQGASRYQARLYERWYKEQADENKQVWRYEVQCRRERAQQMADLLVGASEPYILASSIVHQHFCKRGVAPIFTPTGRIDVAPLPKAASDKEQSLRWLGASVAPALDRHKAWGSYDQAVRALGIDADRLAQ